ncbi:MAG: carboxypeptidase-like regulatory domain-containing protein [Draconibacterium sp.]|nr:carboxypeptidase-like regulatory domain-containing protein [Draconibacterium sp.]
METIFIFLLKASSGIVLFYLVYWFFLRKETFYTANRWFLLTALFTAIFLPLFPVQYSVLADPENNETVLKSISDTFKNIPVVTASELPDEKFNWQQAILLVYLTGASLFLLRLLIQTFILIRLMIKHRVKSLDGIRVVENEKYGLPFSFFNIVFFNPKFHTQEDLPDILAHEKVHIRENHWFDLLFIELLTVIFWFNPFIWFYEHSIKQNHEYLADKGVLAQGHNAGRYQALLINQLMGMQIIGITNNLNFALNTNRLKMMTKKKTSRLHGTKFALALPAIALLLFAFAEPEYKAKPTEILNPVTVVQKGEKEFVIKGEVVRDDNGKPLEGASVIIKGTTIGTVSDKDGKFTVTDPNPEVDNNTGSLSSELVVSYVGFESFVMKVAASGTALENGSFTSKLKEGVIYIDLPDYKNVPPPPPPPPAISDDGEELFIIVEDLPKFPGGIYELAKYIAEMQENLARIDNIKGKAKIMFTISETGKVTNISVSEWNNQKVLKAAATIASQMPDWTPGKQHGKSVPVKYLMPVEFN